LKRGILHIASAHEKNKETKSLVQGTVDETDISTKCKEAQSETRVSNEDEDGRGSGDIEPASSKGSKANHGVVGMRRGFSREARLRRKEEFARIFSRGARFRGATLDIIVGKEANGLATPRLGISISAKVGKAVVRNRLRRLIRESFRRALPEIMGKTVDIVVVAKSGGKKTPRCAIEEELRGVFSRAGIM
jgi:ribonuclease P protein component